MSRTFHILFFWFFFSRVSYVCLENDPKTCSGLFPCDATPAAITNTVLKVSLPLSLLITFCLCCRRFVSLQMVIANTLFRTVCYHPDVYQIITSGTDRKVCFVTLTHCIASCLIYILCPFTNCPYLAVCGKRVGGWGLV